MRPATALAFGALLAVALQGMGLWAGLLAAGALLGAGALWGPPVARGRLAPYAFVAVGVGLVLAAAQFRGLPVLRVTWLW